VPVTCTPTGVKYLHHAAESYDIGVYFEANGHGTVLFSPASIAKLKGAGSGAPEAAAARRQLLALTELINQTVGDALSDMLLVEVVLRVTGRSFAAWDSTYEDLPNRLLKVLVPDRTLFETTDAERRLTRPAGLQAQIEHEAAKYAGGRSFVRPSGTEDCVRVYAECEKADELGALAENIKKLVEDAAKAAAQA
jgi:phosphoacetylglucosamine mutase